MHAHSHNLNVLPYTKIAPGTGAGLQHLHASERGTVDVCDQQKFKFKAGERSCQALACALMTIPCTLPASLSGIWAYPVIIKKSKSATVMRKSASTRASCGSPSGSFARFCVSACWSWHCLLPLLATY